jgi:ABC-type uncharacterized transport system permease subunit
MILSSGFATVLGVAALAAYGAAAVGASGRWSPLSLFVGWLAHGALLALDVFGAEGGAMRFGFAPVLSLTVWLVLAVHAVESRFVPLPAVRRALALAGAAVVVLVAVFPGEMRGEGGSPWLPLHWLLGVACYGLFGAAVLHALMLDAAERRLRPGSAPLGSERTGPLGLPLLRLERLTFRFVEAGFVVLSAALLFGLWSTVQWRWDHKNVLSLLGWATFAALLVGRHLYGWRGQRATRWLYTGALLLTLAYVGSRFVLEVLLRRPA